MPLQIRVSDQLTDYDGSQLRAHWIFHTFGLSGDALVAFRGAANVTLDHMVDQVDVKQNAPIYSPSMLHFMGEWFIDSLDQGILLQHLFVAEVYELLLEKGLTGMQKRGNDLFFDGRKLSVSIATKSGVSVLMHMALNIETEGTPVPTAGLQEMGVEPLAFGQAVLERFEKQSQIRALARVKVAPRA